MSTRRRSRRTRLIGGLSADQRWWLRYGPELMPARSPDFPFESMAHARAMWQQHRAALVAEWPYGHAAEYLFEGARCPWETKEEFEARKKVEETTNA